MLFALSDLVQQSIINGFYGFIGIVALAWINRKVTKTVVADVVKTEITPVKENVQKIELATNSMKDALVASTKAQALLQGGVDERARADEKKELKESLALPQPNLHEAVASVKVDTEAIRKEIEEETK